MHIHKRICAVAKKQKTESGEKKTIRIKKNN